MLHGPFHNFHLGSSGGSTSYFICIQKAIHFISHFQCFMAPFHYFHLGSSRGFTLYLPFSVLHGTISNALILSLLEAIIFMALFHCRIIGSSKAITFFGILNASWPNSTAFIGVVGGYTPYLPFSALLGPIHLFLSRVIWRIYTLLAIFNGPIQLHSSGVFWRPYALIFIFSGIWPHFTEYIWGLMEAINFICLFQCLMSPFN